MVMGDSFDPTRVTWVFDTQALSRLHAVLESASEISFDLETTALDEFSPTAKIVLASFTVPTGHHADTWLLPLYHPESPWLGSWRLIYRGAAMRLVGKYLIAANGKFDCRWTFEHVGVDLAPSMGWDSQASSHLLDENSSTKLKERAPATFGVPRWDDFDLSTEGAALRVPLIDLGLYAARDTYWTWMLAMNHRVRMFTHEESPYPPMERDEIEDARLGRLNLWVVMPSLRTMTRIEERGIALDVGWVERQLEVDRSIRDEQFEALAMRYPEPDHTCLSEECVEDCPAYQWPQPEDASFAPTSHWFKAYARCAVEAGDLRVVSLTKTGQPQWSKEVLVRLERQGSEVAKRILIYRRAVKRIEYMESWLSLVKADGAIHANYNVGVTITGRLSSDTPNMQQITKMLRPAYLPRKGYVIGDFDYSQIEMRVGAYIGRILPMIEAFQRGDDLHRILAARITGKALADVLPDERQGGKAGNFGFLFGQTPFGFKFYAENVYDISFTDDECQDIYNAFFSEWTGMQEWHHSTILKAQRYGQVVSPLGRVRRLPGIYSANPKHAENAALNAPVQGTAADIMQIAAASIEGVLPGHEAVPDVRLIGTVHDSLVAELPEDSWEESAHLIIDRMTRGVLPVLRRMEVDFDVPLVVEASIGSRWGLKDLGEVT